MEGKELTIVKELLPALDELIDKSDTFLKISTRAASGEVAQFHTFDDKKLAKIAERMPVIDRATRNFGKSNSQTQRKMMSLTMLSPAGTPYQQIKQILAQIERKRSALKSTQFKLKKDRIQIAKLEQKHFNTSDVLDAAEIQVEIEELASNICDSILYYEGALKEVGYLQTAYEEICKNMGISEDWDEADMEKAEISHHVKSAFRNALRDYQLRDRIGMGTLEYLEQYGISPFQALEEVKQFIKNMPDLSYDTYMNFLDRMHEKYKDNYKDAMKRMGLETLVDDEFLYLEDKDD